MKRADAMIPLAFHGGTRLQAFAWNHVVNDVRPFIEAGVNVKILTRENLLKLLE